jgi:predicted enzyme related to lactoylglutathione lyase
MMLRMASRLTHFAINTDDVDATREFYGSVFGWHFQDYGPPGFVQIVDDDTRAPIGAIQRRRQLLDDEPTRGFECTFAVDDIDGARARIVEAGGRILMEKFTITDVGHLIAFQDPGGNPVLVMEYDDHAE